MFVSKLKEEFDELLSDFVPSEPAKIERSIEFSPENYRAGLSILTYFSEIIKSKYPGDNVKIKIEQSGNMVTLLIDPPDGQVEKIEQCLSDYMLVVRGKRDAREFLQEEHDVIRLQGMLDIAHLEIRHQQRLLDLKSKDLAKAHQRIDRLETSVEAQFDKMAATMERVISSRLADDSRLLGFLTAVGEGQSQALQESLASIIEILRDNPDSSDQQRIANELERIGKEAPSVLDRLHSFVLKGAVQGTAGNILYHALVGLTAGLPKV